MRNYKYSSKYLKVWLIHHYRIYFVRLVVSKIVMLGDNVVAHTIAKASHFYASLTMFT